MNKGLKVLTISLLMIVWNFSVLVSQNVAKLESKLDSVIQSNMESNHIPGAAFIIVKDGKVLLKKGYGYTSLGEEIRRVRPDSTIFRIGSITKTFTATALMQLVDQGKIDLHTDVNTYLTSLKVQDTFSKPITPWHLLTHSAGFDEISGRRVFRASEQIPLKIFLKDRLIRLREPGVISSYSSYAIALAGLLVEDVSGMSLAEYMKKHIWDPLEMNMTNMGLSDEQERYTSWGYEYRRGINVPQPWEFYHTYPSSDINSTVSDMGKYLLMHLNLGKHNNKTILSSKMTSEMHKQQLSAHTEVEGFGLGFYEEYANGFRTVSHGGDMLGYSGYMALIPEKNLGVYIVSHHEGSRFRYMVLSAILEYFQENKATLEPNPKRVMQDLSKFEGSYLWSTHCHTCENGWKPTAEQLVVNDDNTFSIFGRKFFQIGPLLFKSFDGRRTMGFVENKKGEIIYMSTGSSNVFEKID
tara:strand:- start:43621 stop:45024 length:1404 start_codon:yes stop_codon:yes gene_type:complete